MSLVAKERDVEDNRLLGIWFFLLSSSRSLFLSLSLSLPLFFVLKSYLIDRSTVPMTLDEDSSSSLFLLSALASVGHFGRLGETLGRIKLRAD
jgi:hypothetical protein